MKRKREKEKWSNTKKVREAKRYRQRQTDRQQFHCFSREYNIWREKERDTEIERKVKRYAERKIDVEGDETVQREDKGKSIEGEWGDKEEKKEEI